MQARVVEREGVGLGDAHRRSGSPHRRRASVRTPRASLTAMADLCREPL